MSLQEWRDGALHADVDRDEHVITSVTLTPVIVVGAVLLGIGVVILLVTRRRD